MPVPTYDLFIEPVLRYLAAHPQGAMARDVHEAAATALSLSDGDKSEVLPSGTQRVYKNRAGWAHDRLKRAGYSISPRRGFWNLTDAGRDFAKSNPAPFPASLVEHLASAHNDVRLRANEDKSENVSVGVPLAQATESPDDRLEAAVGELRQSVVADLLDMLGRVSPQYFETIVLDVLHRMGYGASHQDVKRSGGAGDGGIDGVISLDRLGLEKVYIQAKRWQASVGRPEVQGFYGALVGRRATKGVFITTSTFTAQAKEFAESVDKIVLVDGEHFAGLMIECQVGVTLRPVRVPKVDLDYFEEE